MRLSFVIGALALIATGCTTKQPATTHNTVADQLGDVFLYQSVVTCFPGETTTTTIHTNGFMVIAEDQLITENDVLTKKQTSKNITLTDTELTPVANELAAINLPTVCTPYIVTDCGGQITIGGGTQKTFSIFSDCGDALANIQQLITTYGNRY